MRKSSVPIDLPTIFENRSYTKDQFRSLPSDSGRWRGRALGRDAVPPEKGGGVLGPER